MIEWVIATMYNHPEVCFFGAITLIEVVPIKINPWSKLLKWLGNAINGEIRKELGALKTDFQEERANTWRWNILDFANSCRNGRRHTQEEWKYVIDQIEKYEAYVFRNKITNGVIKEESKYLRRLYQERCDKNDFL